MNEDILLRLLRLGCVMRLHHLPRGLNQDVACEDDCQRRQWKQHCRRDTRDLELAICVGRVADDGVITTEAGV
jgi:hypothetical protein